MQNYTHIEPEMYLCDDTLDTSNTSYVYGEVNPRDVISIIKELEDSEFRHFLDIGSGCGKLVLCFHSAFPDMYCDGIEIHHGRYQESLSWLEKYPVMQGFIEFHHHDFGRHYFGNYDVLYCCNAIYSKEDNVRLYHKILSEFSGYAILFHYDHHLKHHLLYSRTVQTSWQKDVSVYVFHIR